MRRQANHFIGALPLSAALLAAGCSMDLGREPINLREGAEIVRLEAYPPSTECAELGNIVGLADRLARVRFTRLKVVEKDQHNALRNAAYALGGDYVYLEPDDPKGNSGVAYQCHSNRPAPNIAPRAGPRQKMPAPAAASPAGPIERAPVQQPKSLKKRLRLLQSLFEEGLITSEEYAAKKKAMLDEL